MLEPRAPLRITPAGRQALLRATAVIFTVWAVLLGTYLANRTGYWSSSWGRARLLHATLATVVGVLLSYGFLLAERRVTTAASHRVRIGVLLLASSVITAAHSVLDVPLQSGLGVPLQADPPMMVWLNFVFYFWVHTAAGGLLMLLALVEALREREGRLARLDAEGARAEASALRLQVQPHFLYNALNGVSALMMSSRVDQADAMLGRLAELLRLSLQADPRSRTSLRSELAMGRCYTDVELARFRPRLKVSYEVDPRLLDAATPALLLLPILEKVVSHASRGRSGAQVRTCASAHEGRLRLVVSSTRSEAPPEASEFAALNERLGLLHPGDAELAVVSRTDGYAVQVDLPFVRATTQPQAATA